MIDDPDATPRRRNGRSASLIPSIMSIGALGKMSFVVKTETYAFKANLSCQQRSRLPTNAGTPQRRRITRYISINMISNPGCTGKDSKEVLRGQDHSCARVVVRPSGASCSRPQSMREVRYQE